MQSPCEVNQDFAYEANTSMRNPFGAQIVDFCGLQKICLSGLTIGMQDYLKLSRMVCKFRCIERWHIYEKGQKCATLLVLIYAPNIPRI